MKRSEYEYIQKRFRDKLDKKKPWNMTGNRGEGYEAGIKAAMSIVHEVFNMGEEATEILLKEDV